MHMYNTELKATLVRYAGCASAFGLTLFNIRHGVLRGLRGVAVVVLLTRLLR